jgi:hypothetical protein
MNFNEWLSSNEVSVKHSFTGSEYDGLEKVIDKRFWICDYRLNYSKDKKPIRNIQPKLIQVFSNDDLPKNKKVYYSPIHFREIKNGKLLSTIIAPFDNTGYRSYTGVSVNIFNTYEECKECFDTQCQIAISGYQERINELVKRTDEIKELIK